MAGRRKRKSSVRLARLDGGRVTRHSARDQVATEEPLEIRLIAGGTPKTVAITMRTPGNDFELAAGFLFAEGVIAGLNDIAAISYCLDGDLAEDQLYNVVNVELRTAALPDITSLERYFHSTSACGVCGRASLELLELRGCSPLAAGPEIAAGLLHELPARLRDAQGLFTATGGLHAAAVFTGEGNLEAIREDVGRHNAMDKVVGWALLNSRLPLSQHAALVSGRASFELVQKALIAKVPIFCAVSAPSSLAVDVAERFNMTLIGFLRNGRGNVYSGLERISVVASMVEEKGSERAR